MRKVVLDTNIFVSALKKGRVRKIIDLWLSDRFDLVISEEIFQEIISVLSRPKFDFSADGIDDLAVFILEKARFVSPKDQVAVCSDPDDNKFLDCALAGEADYIVSGDDHLLKIGKYQNIKILAPAAFIALFKDVR